MTQVLIDRELLEHMRNFTVMHDSGVAGVLRGQIDAILANPTQQGEAVEVRGLQWLDTGHYRKKPPQFGYNPHDWNPLMTVAQHQRITAAMAAEVERLRKFEAAYNEWQEKTDWVQETIKTHELGKHRADVLKDRLARWLERVNQPYDYADVEAAQQKDGN